MSGYTSWADELPAIHHNASFEIEDVTPAKVALDSDELCGSGLPRIVGNSAALRRVLDMVRVVAPTDATVLINGETGTGKELVARAIHWRSRRSAHAFVSVNCAAIPRDLIASELFGHEKGAFTGATQRRLGRFELADGGTIFLDEVGELLPDTQVALLRAITDLPYQLC
jgi:transcriptional regulator with GAF, ATPase, and Fis domain